MTTMRLILKRKAERKWTKICKTLSEGRAIPELTYAACPYCVLQGVRDGLGVHQGKCRGCPLNRRTLCDGGEGDAIAMVGKAEIDSLSLAAVSADDISAALPYARRILKAIQRDIDKELRATENKDDLRRSD